MSTWKNTLVTGLRNWVWKCWDVRGLLCWISLLQLLVLSQQNRSHIKLNLFSTLLNTTSKAVPKCTHTLYICIPPLPYSAPTAVMSLISTGETLHLHDYLHKEPHKSDHISIKWSFLPHLIYFFLLFRNLDLKSHSVTGQGYASPIYCSQLLLTFSPCCPTQVGLPAQLNSKETVWPRTSIFENPFQSAYTLRHFFHYLLSTGEQPQKAELLHENNWDLQHPARFFLILQHLVCCLLKTSNSR